MSDPRSGGGGFDAVERRRLDEALRAGEPLACPACGAPVAQHAVERPRAVSYVRRRVMLVCTGCRRAGAFDLPAGR